MNGRSLDTFLIDDRCSRDGKGRRKRPVLSARPVLIFWICREEEFCTALKLWKKREKKWKCGDNCRLLLFTCSKRFAKARRMDGPLTRPFQSFQVDDRFPPTDCSANQHLHILFFFWTNVWACDSNCSFLGAGICEIICRRNGVVPMERSWGKCVKWLSVSPLRLGLLTDCKKCLLWDPSRIRADTR